jgi:hypothetical protein
MGATPIYGLPWPTLPDPANVPADMEDLAKATEASLAAVAAGIIPFSGRNRIINGDFSVNQRQSISGTTVGSKFFHDRWRSAATGVADSAWYHVDTPALGELPESARSCGALEVGATQTGPNDHTVLTQPIESVRTLSGKTVTVSLWAKASIAGRKVGVEFYQNFGSSGGSVAVSVPMGAITLTTVWARYSVTVAVPSIAGKTIGTGNNDMLILHLWTSSGSSTAARASNIGFQTGKISFWGVQVEEGSVATPFEQKPYADELRACQRFYFRNYLSGQTFNVSGPLNAQVTMPIPYPVPMRVKPTLASDFATIVYGETKNASWGSPSLTGARLGFEIATGGPLNAYVAFGMSDYIAGSAEL